MRLIIILILLSTGCATDMKGVCRHSAVYTALVAGEHYPTRIAKTHVKDNIYHAQAQAWIDGDWEYLRTNGNQVYVSDSENGLKPIRFLTVEEAINRWFRKEVRDGKISRRNSPGAYQEFIEKGGSK